MSDAFYMQEAIELAKRGGGWVNPNPQVGCVIEKNGKIIGRGWHSCFGAPHAEREALANCLQNGNNPDGSTVYVTLEPCAHQGKTPPCADALVQAGVKRVVIGSSDPNPLVQSKGIKTLEAAGISVQVGVCQEACDALNVPFFHYIQTKTPFVIAKMAMTLDGKVATRKGASQWITGVEARARVHEDRSRYAAVMVGIGTVEADEPMLTARPGLPQGHQAHQPLRVVVDTFGRISMKSALMQSAHEFPTAIICSAASEERMKKLERAGCHVIHVPSAQKDCIQLKSALKKLGKMGIDSVMVEGGPSLMGSFFDEQLIDYAQVYIAPKLFGGKDAPSPILGRGAAFPQEAAFLKNPLITQLGNDILVEGHVSYS